MATQSDRERLGKWAVVLEEDANIDRHGAHRIVPMQVLSLGPSRTGTFSVQEALTILGYRDPYHFSSIMANVKDADMWQEALAAKRRGSWKAQEWRQHFDALLGHTAAVTDAPSMVFWKELIEAYPEAKVVLVERDEDKWFKSVSLLLDGTLNPVARYVFRFTDPLWFGRVMGLGATWMEMFFGSRDLEQMKRNARAAYRKHYADIRAAVPKERLLELELSSGWRPLCEFLGKPVPDVAFPKLNEAAALERAFGALMGRALKYSAFNLATVLGMGAVIGGLVWRLSG